MYKKGYSICLGFISLAAASCVAYALALVWENRRKERAARASEIDLTDSEKTELGVSLIRAEDRTLLTCRQDLHPSFRYML